MPELHEISIYTAGKTWSAEKFRELRDVHGFNINASWIDVQDVLTSPDDEFPEEILHDEEYKREIWDNGCKVDCLNADMALVAATPEDGEKHSGSLVELGHVSLYKPVFIHGTCRSFEPVGHSDRAWKAQANVHTIPAHLSLVEGTHWAVRHYQENYSELWSKAREINRLISKL